MPTGNRPETACADALSNRELRRTLTATRRSSVTIRCAYSDVIRSGKLSPDRCCGCCTGGAQLLKPRVEGLPEVLTRA